MISDGHIKSARQAIAKATPVEPLPKHHDRTAKALPFVRNHVWVFLFKQRCLLIKI
jgi:hypothetical protein